MDSIKEQMAVAAEISNAISGPITADAIDEDDLQDELNELEQEVLDERIRGADRVPIHTPMTPEKERAGTPSIAFVIPSTVQLIAWTCLYSPRPEQRRRRRGGPIACAASRAFNVIQSSSNLAKEDS